MKIALITDTHWGVRNDKKAFLDNTKCFLDNTFFPYLDENQIDTVIHLGDLVDRRKYTNTYTMHRLRTDFLEPLQSRDLDVHFILGNHDTYFKNTNEVNYLNEVIGGNYPKFKVYDRATTIEFGRIPICFIPWICDDNRGHTFEHLSTTPAQIAMGHLEIQGFEMYRGSIVSHGDDRTLFDRFDLVFSGHYHHRSSDGHIFYLGSHGEFTWSDFDDPRGFHIFDTETREIKFVQNSFRLFKKIWYNDSTEQEPVDFEEYRDCMVKVIVQEKNNLYAFDKFVENLESVDPIDLQIVEDHLNLNLEDDSDIVNEAESTLDIFKKYIESYDTEPKRRKALENKIVEIYNEALTLE